MKNKELFEKTVGILVKAYQNDTLQHYNCYACAVGNIIAVNCGYGFIKTPDRIKYFTGGVVNGLVWDKLTPIEENAVFCLDSVLEKELSKEVYRQVKATGYSFIQLIDIEMAFETASLKGDKIFNGLMAVIDTLMQIHEATTEEATQAKELFVKIPA